MKIKLIVKRILIFLLIIIFVPIIAAFAILPFYKEEIKGTIIAQIKNNYGLDVKVSDVGISVIDDWPNATVIFKDVKVVSELNKQNKTPVLEASSIRFSLSIMKLIKKKINLKYISISNAEINIIKDVNGEMNCDLKEKPGLDSGSDLDLDLNRIRIVNVHFNFINKQKNKHVELRFMDDMIRVKKNLINYSATISGGVFVGELLFKPEKGAFLKQIKTNLDVNVLFYPDLQTLFVGNNSKIEIDNQTFFVSACLNAKKEKLAIRFMGIDLNYEKSMKLLNKKIRYSLREIAVTNGLDANALIVTELNKGQDPELIVKIKGRKNFVFVGDSKVPFSNVNFDMRVECIPRNGEEPDMSKAKITIEQLTGNIYSVPFKANVLIENLVAPRMKLTCKLNGDGQQINNSVPQTDLKIVGNLKVDVSYSGALKYVNRKDFLGDSTFLKAKVEFKNFTYSPDGTFPLTLNGNATANNDSLLFRALKINTNGGNFLANGIALGFADYVCGISKGFKADLSANSSVFNLSPYLANKNQVKQSDKPNVEKQVNAIKQTNFEFKIHLQVALMTVRKVKGTDLNANLLYKNNSLNVKDLAFKLGNGSFKLSGTMENFEKIHSNVTIENVDVNLLFDQFEDFNQKAILSENLQGTIDVKAALNLGLSNKFGFEPNSAIGNIEFKLKNGHLINYEPLQNVSNFIFRKRNFRDIVFTEINETLDLEGDKIKFSNLELASNVMNLYLDGIYSFKGESNLNVRIPWSNLRSRDKDFVPANLGEEGLKSKALKLNVNGYPNKMKISLGTKKKDPV